MRTCSRAPPRPCRRACKMFQISRPMTPISSSDASASIASNVTTT
jgi:hypothetical protein